MDIADYDLDEVRGVSFNKCSSARLLDFLLAGAFFANKKEGCLKLYLPVSFQLGVNVICPALEGVEIPVDNHWVFQAVPLSLSQGKGEEVRQAVAPSPSPPAFHPSSPAPSVSLHLRTLQSRRLLISPG